MSYLTAGFNAFLERSFVSDPQTSSLNSLPINYFRNMALDQLQVSGTLGNVLQVGGDAGDVTLNSTVGLNSVDSTFLNGGAGGINSGLAGGNVANSSVSGGQARDLTLAGDLKLGGKLTVGTDRFVIDGQTVRLTVTDDQGNEIILLGKKTGAF